MGALTCRIAVEVELRGPPADQQLDSLEDRLAAIVADRLAQANREIASRQSWPDFARAYLQPEIEFAGGEMSEALRGLVAAAIEAGIKRALTSVPGGKGATLVLPAPRSSRARRPRWLTARKPEPGAPWSVLIDVPFHTRPRDFLQIYAQSVHTSDADLDLSEVYFDLLDEHWPTVAWVIELHQTFELAALLKDVENSYSAKRHPDGLNFAVGGDHTVRQSFALIDLDKKLESAVPDFSNKGLVENRPTPDGGSETVLGPGSWVFVAFMAMPRIDISTLVEFGQPTSIQMKIGDLEGLVAALDFLADMNFSFGRIIEHVPDALVTIWITPFVVRQKVNAHSLAALLGEERHKTYGVRRLGRAVPLNNLAGERNLPGPVRAALTALPSPPSQRAGAAGIKGGVWQPGARGASLSFVFPANLPKMRLADEKREGIEQHFREVKRILALEDTMWNSAERTTELGRYVDRWDDVHQPLLFELLLDRLNEAGLLDEFFNAVRNLGVFDGQRRRTIIRLGSETIYASRKSFADLVAYMNAAVADTNRYRYDFTNQTVWIDGTAVQSSGPGADGDAGVIYTKIPFFSESARTTEILPEALDRLKGPIEDYITKYMGTKICGGAEELTGDALVQKALDNAVATANPPIGEKDVRSVEAILSVRIIKIEASLEAGVTETRVTFQDVRKIGDQPWQPSGAIRRATAYEFESRLTIFTVKHEMRLLTIMALAETALLGGIFVVEVASLGELVLFVGLAVYQHARHAPASEQTIEGYLTAILTAELQIVGFRAVSGLARGASQLLTRSLLSREIITNASAKWLLFGLRGTFTAVGIGGIGVVEQFAKDLVSYSHCGGWSSPATYWDRFTSGFIMGMVFEFVAIPVLSPPIRRLIEKASTNWEVVRALRMTGKSYTEISALLEEGTANVEAALGRTIQRSEGQVLAKTFRQKMADIGKTLLQEYQTNAYRSLLELYGQDLSAAGARGLRRLLSVAGEAEADRALQAVLKAKGSPSAVLAALEGVDSALLERLTKSGQLAQLATSPRALKALSSGGKAGGQILGGPFKSSVRRFEEFLGKLDDLPAHSRDDIVRALTEHDPLPPDLLLDAARDLGKLDAETLDLLRRLHRAGVDAKPLFTGSAVPMRSFAEEFGRFGKDIQAGALDGAEGQTPQQILQRARQLEADVIARAEAEEQAAAQEASSTAEELEGPPEFEGPPEPPAQPDGATGEAQAKPGRRPRTRKKPAAKKPGDETPPNKAPPKSRKGSKAETVKPPKEKKPKLPPKPKRPAPVILDAGAASRGKARLAWLNRQRLDEIGMRNAAQEERLALITRLRARPRLALKAANQVDEYLDRIARERARPDITPQEIEELDQLADDAREVEKLRQEIEARNGVINHYGSVATPAAIEEINRAASRIAKLLRRYGRNYEKLKGTVFDQILGVERWTARTAKMKRTPALENDHIVSVDRITKLDEMTDLLDTYAKASPAQKEEIVEGLRQIGDRPDNLKRMQAAANNRKLERSWNVIDPSEMQQYGYTADDIADLIVEEQTALSNIKAEIARMTTEQRAKLGKK